MFFFSYKNKIEVNHPANEKFDMDKLKTVLTKKLLVNKIHDNMIIFSGLNHMLRRWLIKIIGTSSLAGGRELIIDNKEEKLSLTFIIKFNGEFLFLILATALFIPFFFMNKQLSSYIYLIVLLTLVIRCIITAITYNLVFKSALEEFKKK